MFKLCGVPNMVDAESWDHGEGSEQGINFVRWPADIGSNKVVVRINTADLSDLDGQDFAIVSHMVSAALERHRELIQRCAEAKYRRGDIVVTLETADLR